MFKVARLTAPVSRYHVPLPSVRSSLAGSSPGARHRASSFTWVPLSSPREAKVAEETFSACALNSVDSPSVNDWISFTSTIGFFRFHEIGLHAI